MYDAGKILRMGGDNPGFQTADMIDLNQTTPQWVATANMFFPMRQINAVIMANGQVMVSGGASGPDFNPATNIIYTPEVWDPVQHVGLDDTRFSGGGSRYRSF